jgi:hypothetical protein
MCFVKFILKSPLIPHFQRGKAKGKSPWLAKPPLPKSPFGKGGFRGIYKTRTFFNINSIAIILFSPTP